MGIFSFIASVGEKLAGASEAQAADKAAEQTWRQAALKNVPAKLGLPVSDFTVALNGDVAVLTGKVSSREIEEKIVLAVGNTVGVGSVDDRLEVAASSVSAPASAVSPAQASVFYTVKKGDNLSTIAKEQYGSASKYMAIFEANKPMLKDPDKIYVGQVLRIPEGLSWGDRGVEAGNARRSPVSMRRVDCAPGRSRRRTPCSTSSGSSSSAPWWARSRSSSCRGRIQEGFS